MPSRVRLGDVLEFETNAGLAYLQVTHRDPVHLELVRVLPGTYAERPRDVGELARGPERFIAFYPTDAAVRQRLVRFVDNYPIPAHAQAFPEMLLPGMEDRDGRTMGWWLYDGKREQLVDEKRLDDYRRLPVGQTLLHQGLINAVLGKGRPDQFPVAAMSRGSTGGASTQRTTQSLPTDVVAFLDAPTESAARAAASEIALAGFETVVAPSAADHEWRLSASAPWRPDLELSDVDSLFESVARRISGRYDGHEVRFGAAPTETKGTR